MIQVGQDAGKGEEDSKVGGIIAIGGEGRVNLCPITSPTAYSGVANREGTGSCMRRHGDCK